MYAKSLEALMLNRCRVEHCLDVLVACLTKAVLKQYARKGNVEHDMPSASGAIQGDDCY
jgi:hypothetical protein